jgi:hypothetical protein
MVRGRGDRTVSGLETPSFRSLFSLVGTIYGICMKGYSRAIRKSRNADPTNIVKSLIAFILGYSKTAHFVSKLVDMGGPLNDGCY